MAQIAPWLAGPDVLGAMSRGAQLGLSARSQDTAESNAADRLRMAYDQMASEERRQSAQAAQALMIKQQEQQALNAYRKGELANKQAEILAKNKAAQALQQHYEEMKRHNIALEGKPRLHNVPGVGLVQEDADGKVSVVMDAKNKEETDRQKESTQIAAAHLFALDPNSPGYNVATNVAGNILGKYGMMPKPPPTPTEDSGPQIPWASGIAAGASGVPGLAMFAGATRNSPAATTLLSGKPSSSGRVKVKSPSGKVGTIPADQLDEALSNGYEKVQ